MQAGFNEGTGAIDGLEIKPIPAFRDNYLWLFRPLGERECCIVDPGDAGPVLKHLQDRQLELAAIFVTHHHQDHTGGISRLLEHCPVPVYGPHSANIPWITRPLQEGDTVEIFDCVFQILEIPGHTLDHIAYFTSGAGAGANPLLFCGDTLFAGGCGRVFEGTHPMMHASLQKLARLPPATQVFCAHEYTLANLAFAKAAMPSNGALLERMRKEQDKRDRDLPTVPTRIGLELSTNPFLRCADPELIASAEAHAGRPLREAAEVFAAVRGWKDAF